MALVANRTEACQLAQLVSTIVVDVGVVVAGRSARRTHTTNSPTNSPTNQPTTTPPHLKVRYLLVDFAHVKNMDHSSGSAFADLLRDTNGGGIVLVLTGMNDKARLRRSLPQRRTLRVRPAHSFTDECRRQWSWGVSLIFFRFCVSAGGPTHAVARRHPSTRRGHPRCDGFPPCLRQRRCTCREGKVAKGRAELVQPRARACVCVSA